MPDSLIRAFDFIFFGSTAAFSPLYLLSFCFVAWLVFLYRREGGSFLRWLFPREVYTHQSLKIDVVLYLIAQVLLVFGLLARFGGTPVVAAYVAGIMPYAPFGDLQLSPVLLALSLFVIGDFSLYWIHRLHHSINVIWPLHAVHHSAEVLSPITTYRQHPLSPFVNTAMQTFITGAIFGVFIGVINPNATVFEIAGANAFVVIVNLTTTHFQHSHIWISFGPILERVFISPAQHQVHHSIEPKHYNKNYGQTLAIWDWMFGSLYITAPNEVVTFGLSDEADAPLMTHRLWPILWSPLRRMFDSATGR